MPSRTVAVEGLAVSEPAAGFGGAVAKDLDGGMDPAAGASVGVGNAPLGAGGAAAVPDAPGEDTRTEAMGTVPTWLDVTRE